MWKRGILFGCCPCILGFCKFVWKRGVLFGCSWKISLCACLAVFIYGVMLFLFFALLCKDSWIISVLLGSLLRYSSQWNTNSRHCRCAQVVVNIILQSFTTEELLALPDFSTSLEGLIPYTGGPCCSSMFTDCWLHIPLSHLNRFILPHTCRNPV